MSNPNPTTASDVTKDAREHAIIAAIRAETDAFLREDYEAWSACWIQDDRTRDLYASPIAGISALDGWAEVSAHMRHVIDSGLACRKQIITQENFNISIDSHTAWVVFDGHSEDQQGTTHLNYETRILENGPTGWKIVYSSVIERHQIDRRLLEVAVDGTGRIVLAGSESLAALKQHPILTVSRNRIRARRLEWDKLLQSEITRAGAYHGFFELHRFATESGGALQYPVILGDTGNGNVAIIHISVRDCMTFIRLDGDGLLAHRLATARAVFGISEGQMRIASRIAAGESLSDAATALQISINTARTHLSRLYEKTGVKSQTALVRLLLSVG